MKYNNCTGPNLSLCYYTWSILSTKNKTPYVYGGNNGLLALSSKLDGLSIWDFCPARRQYCNNPYNAKFNATTHTMLSLIMIVIVS